MELDISNNENEIFLNCIMCGHALSLMSTTKYVYPCGIYGLVAYAMRKTTSCGMGEAQSGS
jgi:hypothetical protein